MTMDSEATGNKFKKTADNGTFSLITYTVVMLTSLTTTLIHAASISNQIPATLAIQAAPRPEDWRAFFQAPEVSREQLWLDHRRQGKLLKDWAWGWRLGWVRACSKSRRDFCQQIMREAVNDKALVVRAEAATQLGRFYEDSANPNVVSLLASAYQNPRNWRHGRPLIVPDRILFALSRIGGNNAQQVARELAKQHLELKKYWSRLERGANAGKG